MVEVSAREQTHARGKLIQIAADSQVFVVAISPSDSCVAVSQEPSMSAFSDVAPASLSRTCAEVLLLTGCCQRISSY
jgi:hypothetical protein